MLTKTTGSGNGRGGTIVLAILLSGLTCNAICCEAQQAATKPAADDGGTADLAKATQNPVSSLISVPVQNNDNFGIEPFNRTQNVLNIQPVVPLQISKDWNMVIRWIMPIIFQPAPGTANLELYGIEENTPAYFGA